MAVNKIRTKIETGEFFCVPGIPDMITAVIARNMGFEAVYASGFWMGASMLGIPDVGITTYTQMLDRVSTLVKTMPQSAVIADADTGYGGLINMRETVRGYEAAGVQVIQIEDQEFPKKCGHTPNKRVVSTDTMVAKIKVAVDSRNHLNTMIAARTDARQGEGFNATIERMLAYQKAGADIIFPEGLVDEKEIREACASVNKPVMLNMADGATDPIYNAQTLAEMGVAFAIFPSTAALAAASATKHALTQLQQTGSSVHQDVTLFDFKEFCQLIGFEEIFEFERRWAEK